MSKEGSVPALWGKNNRTPHPPNRHAKNANKQNQPHKQNQNHKKKTPSRKTQEYQSEVKAFSSAKVMSTFKWTTASKPLKHIALNPPSCGSIGGSSKISRLPKYCCLLGNNILMLPRTIQDADLMYKFIVKHCNISLLGGGNASVLSGAKIFGQGSLSEVLITALSLNDT